MPFALLAIPDSSRNNSGPLSHKRDVEPSKFRKNRNEAVSVKWHLTVRGHGRLLPDDVGQFPQDVVGRPDSQGTCLNHPDELGCHVGVGFFQRTAAMLSMSAVEAAGLSI
jgi:hypothetical protein